MLSLCFLKQVYISEVILRANPFFSALSWSMCPRQIKECKGHHVISACKLIAMKYVMFWPNFVFSESYPCFETGRTYSVFWTSSCIILWPRSHHIFLSNKCITSTNLELVHLFPLLSLCIYKLMCNHSCFFISVQSCLFQY